MAEKPYEEFAEKLIREANIVLPEDELTAYKERVANQIQERVGLVLLNHLNKKDLKKFGKLLERNSSQEEIVAFLTSHVRNYEEVVVQALEGFAKDFFEALRKSEEESGMG